MTSIDVAGVSVDTRHFIGGERVASDTTFRNTSPIDGSFLGDIARGGQREVDLAVAAADAAFPVWGSMPPFERAAVMNRIADLVEQNLEQLAAVETMDLRIWNRWGELVFESTSLDHGWDGTYKGKPQEMDAYAFVLTATFIDGKTFEKQGNITLLR